MDELKRTFEKYLKRSLGQYQNPTNLYAPFNYSLNSGGKRLRPLALLLTGTALEAREDILLPAALGVEFFHNFSLIHDDIMDEASLRRGIASVPAFFGRDSAILSGDTMLIQAFRYILEATKRAHADWFVVDQFNQMATKLCEGQQMDMDFENLTNEVSFEDYIEMVGKKTAVLFAFCLQSGGYLATKDQSIAMKLYRIGLNAGVAFQMQDDYLDFFADEKILGKKLGGDIARGKKTAPILLALRQADDTDRSIILNLSDKSRDDENRIITAAKLFDKYKVKELLAEQKNDFRLNATEELSELILSFPKLKKLNRFLEKLFNRTY